MTAVPTHSRKVTQLNSCEERYALTGSKINNNAAMMFVIQLIALGLILYHLLSTFKMSFIPLNHFDSAHLRPDFVPVLQPTNGIDQFFSVLKINISRQADLMF